MNKLESEIESASSGGGRCVYLAAWLARGMTHRCQSCTSAVTGDRIHIFFSGLPPELEASSSVLLLALVHICIEMEYYRVGFCFLGGAHYFRSTLLSLKKRVQFGRPNLVAFPDRHKLWTVS